MLELELLDEVELLELDDVLLLLVLELDCEACAWLDEAEADEVAASTALAVAASTALAVAAVEAACACAASFC